MSKQVGSHRLSRRAFLAGVGTTAFGAAFLAACAPSAAPAAPAPAGGGAVPAGGKEKVTVRAHMVQKQDVSDWIQVGLDTDIDGFVSGNPDIEVVLETIPGWMAEYQPKILSFAAAGTLGDAVWYPPRHRSHIAWGVNYGIVTDLRPLAESAGYDIDANFYAGAVTANSWEGSTYWMSYISEPIVPVIAYNKTKIAEMGVAEPTDEWTFAELAAWAQEATTEDAFAYYLADRSLQAFSGGPYLRQWGIEPVNEDGTQCTLADFAEPLQAALQNDYDMINTLKVSPSPRPAPSTRPSYSAAKKCWP